MKLYHMGEGMQGILNGCSHITECRKKLTELQGLLQTLLEQNGGPTSTIDMKISMVEDTILQYEILIETMLQQAKGLGLQEPNDTQESTSQKRGLKNNSKKGAGRRQKNFYEL